MKQKTMYVAFDLDINGNRKNSKIFEDFEDASKEYDYIEVLPVVYRTGSKSVQEMTETITLIVNTVKKILEKHFECDIKDVKLNDKILENMGSDSLDEIEIIMDIEEEFGINFSSSDMGSMKMTTIGEISEAILKKLKKT